MFVFHEMVYSLRVIYKLTTLCNLTRIKLSQKRNLINKSKSFDYSLKVSLFSIQKFCFISFNFWNIHNYLCIIKPFIKIALIVFVPIKMTNTYLESLYCLITPHELDYTVRTRFIKYFMHHLLFDCKCFPHTMNFWMKIK